MGTTADKLLAISNSKVAIRDAIVAKGVTVPVGTVLSDYATKISEITTGGGGSETADTWVRPTEWLALPDNVDGVQKVSILNAVFDTDSEFVALLCRGAYTVDWGDGVTENFADNVKAEHKYTYSDVDLNSDTVATFRYKQCIITITPQVGNNLTFINLNLFHPSIGSSLSYDLTTGFLDIRVNSSLCTTLSIGLSSSYVKHTMLEQCLIGELADTTLSELFYDCYSLQSVSIKDTSSVTSFASMHYNNHSLQKMPTYTFRSAGVDVSNMYMGCYSLRETYPLSIRPSSSGAFSSMFNTCKSLKYINLTINSSINFSFSNVFTGCSALEDIKLYFTETGKITNLSTCFNYTKIKESPAIDTSLCTNFSGAFQYCDRLTDLYEYNYTSATTLANMLDGCYSLKSVPNFNITTSCTNLSALCNNCWSLEKAPTFSNSSGVTSITTMLQYCKSITTIPNYVFGSIVSNMNTPFGYMDSLQMMPNISVGTAYTSTANFVLNSYSLKRMLMPLRFTFSVANAKMSAEALNEMYSILPTVTNQTVTVTDNYGATSTPITSRANFTATSNSKTITTADTSGITIGMVAYGSGVLSTTGSGVPGTGDTTLNTVYRNNHGLVVGDIVAFNSVSTTGLPLKTIMYVVTVVDANNFKVSLTQNGSAFTILANASVSYNTPAIVTDIVPNTSIRVTIPAISSGTFTLGFRSNTHKTYIATMKGWTVTG